MNQTWGVKSKGKREDDEGVLVSDHPTVLMIIVYGGEEENFTTASVKLEARKNYSRRQNQRRSSLSSNCSLVHQADTGELDHKSVSENQPLTNNLGSYNRFSEAVTSDSDALRCFRAETIQRVFSVFRYRFGLDQMIYMKL